MVLIVVMLHKGKLSKAPVAHTGVNSSVAIHWLSVTGLGSPQKIGNPICAKHVTGKWVDEGAV